MAQRRAGQPHVHMVCFAQDFCSTWFEDSTLRHALLLGQLGRVGHLLVDMRHRHANTDTHLCGYVWHQVCRSYICNAIVHQRCDTCCYRSSFIYSGLSTGTPYAWSAWSAWGTCTSTCGTGTQTSTRTCDGTCGTICAGAASQTQSCSVGASFLRSFLTHHPALTSGTPYAWSSWSVWGTCSNACGSGTQLISRTCVGTCGAPCPGAATQTQGCAVGKLFE